jgi:hypothetical protein
MTQVRLPVLPIRVSGNNRYFVDQENQPVFWLGDTQWELFRSFSLEDARAILVKRRSQGFTVLQIKLFGGGDGLRENVNGETPWKDRASLTPNENYFHHIDAILAMAGEMGMTLSIALYHQRYREYITLEKARGWACWLASRYRDVPNIVWSTTPEGTEAFVPILREFAAGLREGDGGAHLITFKPDPAPFTSTFLHEEEWLDFNCMQVWKWVNLILPFIQIDYAMKPVKPVVMAEGAYEAGTEYGFDVTPLWVRRQAYYSYLAGSHHSYGHNDCWRVLPTWRSSLDAPGAQQLSLLRSAFLAREEWWNLVPDQGVFAEGGRVSGELLNLGARHRDGRWAMAYLASPGSVKLRMDRVEDAGRGVSAQWIDPRSGESTPLGKLPRRGEETFTTPAGFEDALLILERGA